MAQDERTNGQGICTHGIRGLDPATRTCIPCRDEQVFCRDCGTAASVTDWLRYSRRCEPCFDQWMRNADFALQWGGVTVGDRELAAAQRSAVQALRAELRAQDRGGA